MSDPVSDAGWQRELQSAIRDPEALASALGITIENVDAGFPLLVPRPYLDRIKPGDRSDPLLLQVMPVAAELIQQPGFSHDPVFEQDNNSQPRGLIQKYRGRALIIATGTCAVNCRYCFRRHYPYDSQRLSRDDWQTLFTQLVNDQSIHEVILSGGDPLILNDRTLSNIIGELNQIPHITTVRIHTRLPVVIPERICDELLNWVERCQKQMVFVTHINHPNEIDASLVSAMQRLKSHGPTLLNQGVLLKNVNDDAGTLVELSRQLFSAGVMPYYLHLLDPVQGAGHFDVPESKGRKLIESVAAELPGYLVPKLAREQPGAAAKQVLAG